jgi:hypothetical protein
VNFTGLFYLMLALRMARSREEVAAGFSAGFPSVGKRFPATVPNTL